MIPTRPAAAPWKLRGCRKKRQRDLFVFGLHHLSFQCVQALYLLAQRRYLLVEPGALGLGHCLSLAISAIKLREVASNALVNLRQPPLVWGFLCQGGITPFLWSFVIPFFCSTCAATILSSRPHICIPSRAAAVKDGASSAPPKVCP